MDQKTLIGYLEGMDAVLECETMLYVYGSAALILFGEEDRTSMDIDVAIPYSQADFATVRRAAEHAGLAVNPDETCNADHIELIGALRLCLPPPIPGQELLLWRGRMLRVVTGPITDLIASKLIRYDEIDQSDMRYLNTQIPVKIEDVRMAVSRLPAPFNCDALVLENLRNLETDLMMWSGNKP